jgi:hypothetical protein
MPESVTVHFDLSSVPGMHRHRVSVWNEDGGLLRPSSAEPPADLEVTDGDTFVVEASTPIENKRKPTNDRDEARWRLRARQNSSAVLELGKSRFNKGGIAVAIRIEGAEQIRREPRSA